MSKYFSEEERNEKLSKLNACNNAFCHWEQRRAKKKHVDLFGEEIKEGEDYFRMRIDERLSNDLKLSEETMDKFLFAIFAPYPVWEKEAEKQIERNFDKAREIIDSVLRGGNDDKR